MQGRKEEVKKIQREYVKNRISGLGKDESKIKAGYSPCTKASDIERVGGPVMNLMMKELEKAGITEEFLSREYRRGLNESTTPKGRIGDYNAHAKYLLQLGYLMGYGKQGPLVAIQNNYGASQELDTERAGELLEKIEGLLPMLEKEIGLRKPDGIHEGDSSLGNSEAYS